MLTLSAAQSVRSFRVDDGVASKVCGFLSSMSASFHQDTMSPPLRSPSNGFAGVSHFVEPCRGLLSRFVCSCATWPICIGHGE